MKNKIKSKSAAKKRFKVSGSGKVKYKKQFLRHILIKKSKGRKRHLRKPGILSKPEQVRMRRILPNSF